MHKTYNGRRVYDREDLHKAADIVRQALESAGKGRGYYTEKEVNRAASMLEDIANGMMDDDGIVCDDYATMMEHGV